MGTEKFHYDISMSKRTRKPSITLSQEHDNKSDPAEESAGGEEFANGELKEKEEELENDDEAEENDERRKSLKQLINGGRSSLIEHFSDEEKQKLPLMIVKPHHHDQEGLDRLKLKRMVSRYAKVLSHMIKLKRKPESAFQKKSFLKVQ